MFVVTVEFEVRPEHGAQFRDAVVAQAQNSLERETQCSRFDVSVAWGNPARFFLYEIYDDEAAFQVHLGSEHFHRFDDTVRPWVVSKAVQSWSLILD